MALPLRHLIRATLALLWFAATIARAQTPSAPATPVQFRVVTLTQVETLLFDAGKTKETIFAGIGSFSQLYPAPKNGAVSFYKEVPNADPALPPTKVFLAKAQLPAAKPGPFLIMLNRNPPGSELTFSALVVDASLEAHPSKTYRVFNFSKRLLAVNIADTKMVLEPSKQQGAPYPTTRKAWLQVAANEDPEGWLLVSSSPHPVGSDSRTTILLVDIAPSERDPNPKGIIARRIRETITTDDKGIQHVQ